MDPLTRLNVMHLQETLPMPLDLTKQISEAVDLVKKKPSRSSRASRPHSICSSRSESGYESARVPLNTSLPNGFSYEPVKTLITVTGNVQADNSTINKTRPSRTRLDKREKNGAGPQDTPSVRPSLTLPLPEVETLSSECSGPGYTQYISSDGSDVIEVPANVSVSNDTSLRRRVPENEKWKKERMESSCLGMMEWDVLQDSDSLESRNVPSTSEAENADFCKATQNGSVTSSSSSSHKRAPVGKKNRNQQHARPSAGKKATTSTAKRKKKKKSSGLSSSSSAFPSNEAEIKLKYASCKEAKRDSRANTFAPYVRIELSACTVVNFEEDGDVQVRKQRRPMVSPGIVPATSCLQLGRLGSEGRSQTGELCCLCGWMANAAGLGDLHGPYHPCRPDRKTSVDPQINGHEDAGAKRKRKSDEVGEHWVHEDCSIWSAGVFLVKGRLYGLDEALRIAQKAVCSCCQRSGATLGCFFKGCPSKYHFPCALQAECVFNEENFTLRCPKHKNKLGLGVSRLQNR